MIFVILLIKVRIKEYWTHIWWERYSECQATIFPYLLNSRLMDCVRKLTNWRQWIRHESIHIECCKILNLRIISVRHYKDSLEATYMRRRILNKKFLMKTNRQIIRSSTSWPWNRWVKISSSSWNSQLTSYINPSVVNKEL